MAAWCFVLPPGSRRDGAVATKPAVLAVIPMLCGLPVKESHAAPTLATANSRPTAQQSRAAESSGARLRLRRRAQSSTADHDAHAQAGVNERAPPRRLVAMASANASAAVEQEYVPKPIVIESPIPLGQIRYSLEQALTWNPALKAFLLASSFLLMAYVGARAYERVTGYDTNKSFWMAWAAISGAEPDFSEDPPKAKVVVLALTVIQLFFFAFLLSIVETGIQGKLEELAAGRTPVYEDHHQLVLGWNPSVPRVLEQMRISAQTNREHRKIVILAPLQKKDMEQAVSEAFEKKGGLKVICRSGDPSNYEDLELVRVDKASRIMVLSSKRGQGSVYDSNVPANVADNLVFKTGLAIKRLTGGNTPTMMETFVPKSSDLIPYLGEKVTSLNWMNLVTKQIVQSATNGQGMPELLGELISFEGYELYMMKKPELAGTTFGDASKRVQGACLLGIVKHDSTTNACEKLLLNPPPTDTVLDASDSLLLLAENKLRVRVTPEADTTIPEIPKRLAKRLRRNVDEKVPRHVLVLGWRAGMREMLQQLDVFYEPGSVVTVVSRKSASERNLELRSDSGSRLRLRNIRVNFVEGDMADPALISEWRRRSGKSFNEHSGDAIIVLLDEASGAHNANEREAAVLEALVATKACYREMLSAEKPAKLPKVIVEVESKSTEELARAEVPYASVLTLDDFSSCLLAQGAYNPDILPVWDYLLGDKGVDFKLFGPKSLFYEKDVDALSYKELEVRARAQGRILLGYTTKSDPVAFHFGPDVAGETLQKADISSFVFLGASAD
ncbi:putative ion channel POLLUX [Porphyridium purpureum]|uniref:Putative ion channel POLLUX n=1 Tax=Porphyridium purpureum TaxID=35688 RepID=A0A5J4YV80_PORPP|nr:putative ion channel POLLUX [Porphyridium purpureum]|eukprot:POR7680..scf227_4